MISLDSSVNNKLKNKVLLITGGTGSFGSTVLRTFINSDLQEIRVFSRDEKKQDDLRLELKNKKIKFIVGDVRDFDSVKAATRDVNYVFHAAALKQVPSCEFFPIEAVKTNIYGTFNVLKAGGESNVEKIICLSTDKAAYPINAMGTSKAMMEKVALAEARRNGETGCKICITRYGNVMASRGSVIPLIIRQINGNHPITITEPKMTRFIMSLDDAVELVLYALSTGDQGDLLIQKSPACSIGDLADGLKKLFSSRCPTEIIGPRHGEKLHETLLTAEEFARAEEMGSYFRVRPDTRDLVYSKYLEEGNPLRSNFSEYNSENAQQLSVDQIVEKLKTLNYVPEIAALNK
jgi:UDP-glucose 4-epimerase